MNVKPVETPSVPAYEAPTIKVLSDEEVLRAFQMTAAQIGAAATWWTASCAAC
jgi:hypothetical protein